MLSMYSLDTTTSRELGSYLWAQFRSVIPCSLQYAENCRQFFEVAVAIFKSLDHMNQESLEFETLIGEWTRILLAHKCREVSIRLPRNPAMVGHTYSFSPSVPTR